MLEEEQSDAFYPNVVEVSDTDMDGAWMGIWNCLTGAARPKSLGEQKQFCLYMHLPAYTGCRQPFSPPLFYVQCQFCLSFRGI